MQTNVAPVLALILNSEQGYQASPADGGNYSSGKIGDGALLGTNHGVTPRTLAAWRKIPVDTLTADTMKALDQDEARDIFKAQYLTPVRFDDLPSGLDYALADCSVNSGPSRAARILQGILGTDEDGVIGQMTIAALADRHVPTVISSYCAARMAFMRTLSNWSVEGNGWTARVERVERAALQMADLKRPTITPVPVAVVIATAKTSGSTKLTSSWNGKAVILSVIGSLGALSTAAGTASGFLSPYDGIKIVHYALAFLAVVSAICTLFAALERAAKGDRP